MNFYLVTLPKCQSCTRNATHALHTSGSERYGYFCKRCGEIEVRRRNKEEVDARQRGESWT